MIQKTVRQKRSYDKEKFSKDTELKKRSDQKWRNLRTKKMEISDAENSFKQHGKYTTGRSRFSIHNIY